jgi:hypothetical protein
MLLDLFRRSRVLFQPGDSVRFTLTNLVTVVAVPGARFLDQLLFHAQVNQLAEEVDTFAVLLTTTAALCCRKYCLITAWHA